MFEETFNATPIDVETLSTLFWKWNKHLSLGNRFSACLSCKMIGKTNWGQIWGWGGFRKKRHLNFIETSILDLARWNNSQWFPQRYIVGFEWIEALRRIQWISECQSNLFALCLQSGLLLHHYWQPAFGAWRSHSWTNFRTQYKNSKFIQMQVSQKISSKISLCCNWYSSSWGRWHYNQVINKMLYYL